MKTKAACILIAAALLASCKKEEVSTTTPSAAPPSAALSKVLGTLPTGEAKPIHLIRTTAKPGDQITVSGIIMGNVDPFVEGRSAFILGDPAMLTPCNKNPGDECKTPWDNCCDSKEAKKSGIVTIQVMGADGRVLKESIEGVGGLNKLADVTVSGTVAEGSSADLLMINAQAIRAGK